MNELREMHRDSFLWHILHLLLYCLLIKLERELDIDYLVKINQKKKLSNLSQGKHKSVIPIGQQNVLREDGKTDTEEGKKPGLLYTLVSDNTLGFLNQIRDLLIKSLGKLGWQQRNSYRMTTLAQPKESDARTICRKNTQKHFLY